ncbi:MAG: SOS response-associated peptidase family protein [Kiritimatiellae bacterium]|nr:SOS response-associated peptidase family protein [Kiritimatiellia bacterium]
MCTLFHRKEDDGFLRSLAERAETSRLAAGFRRAGKAVAAAGDIRPTDVVAVLAPGRDGEKAVFPMRWGFRLPGGGLVVNARTETAAEKPLFAAPWARRRCLVPASWYCEWAHETDASGRKRVGAKYRIGASDGSRLMLCGLYRMEGEEPVFAILTRRPTAELARLHDRMPLILPEELADAWTRPATRAEDLLPHARTDLAAVPAAK